MSIEDVLTADAEIARINEKLNEMMREKRGYDTELAAIKNRIRSGGRLPQQEYIGHCRRQTLLKQKILAVENAVGPLKAERAKWQILRNEADSKARVARPKIDDSEILGVRSELVDLRAKYLAFAEDHTRVNSMRLMAGEFASELTRILGHDLRSLP